MARLDETNYIGQQSGSIINGNPGGFFGTHRGLNQGNPLSPLLFNLLSNTLATMLENARTAGTVRGLVPDLIEGRLHTYNMPMTVIFLTLEEESIIHTKLFLYCFENMSGLHINYQKSEVLVIDGSDSKQIRVDEAFNCKVGSLPMKYLGVKVSNKHMTISDLAYVYQKVEKRIPTW
jgi:hypothetical protein